ncbi:hypothetical protein [Pleurocapsa sp. FMAR1]|uniref:hypothetical protein n=1 Tax=Pleurocapsa sp. FMAR1 TaxID=3040204 RepID=UPI0029C8B54A|nr:hypothetical protein [Pleurocapsa sp. FMAR1]
MSEDFKFGGKAYAVLVRVYAGKPFVFVEPFKGRTVIRAIAIWQLFLRPSANNKIWTNAISNYTDRALAQIKINSLFHLGNT